MEISTIEAGKLQIRPEFVRVDEMTGSVALKAREAALKNANRFEVRCMGEFKPMWADPMKFRQSLLSLLSNACKFTHDGAVTLEVVRESRDGRDWVDWHVRDTGIGIAPEDRDALFQPFSQSGETAVNSPGSTGLGLAISRSLCRMMGGDILYQSEPGKGSTFTIRMPLAGEGSGCQSNQ